MAKMQLILCDGCGKGLRRGDGRWRSTDGRLMCFECMLYPLYVLKQAYNAKTFAKAKAIILEFDEGCEPSFLSED